MFPLTFEKKTAEHLLRCLDEGIATGRVHTLNDVIAVARACSHAIMTHGPVWRNTAAEMQGITLEAPETKEHEEADQQMVPNDLFAAVAFAAQLTQLVQNGGHSDQFEEKVLCGVTQTVKVEPERRVIPFDGFKDI